MATYSQALTEAFAHVQKGVVIHETFQFLHEDKESIYWVVGKEELTAQIETGDLVTFKPIALRYSDPAKNDQGFPEISIIIDNVNREPSDYINSISSSNTPLFMVFRRFLSTNLTTPSQSALKFTVKDVKVTPFEVSIRATTTNVKNKKGLSQLYTRRRFPSIGN